MKKCSKCGAFMYDTELFCKSCGEKYEAVETEETPKEKPRKSKRRYILASLILIPTLLLGIYAVLKSMGVIPDKVRVSDDVLDIFGIDDNITIEFYDMDEPEMELASIICYIACPCIFVLLWVIITGKNNKLEENEEDMLIDSLTDDSTDSADPISVSDHTASVEEKAEEKKEEMRRPVAPPPPPPPPRISFGVLKKLDAEYRAKPVSGLNAKDRADAENKPLVLKDQAKQLISFAESKGLVFTEKTACAVIAAIATDCILLIDGRQTEKGKAVISAIANYFGGTLNPHSVGKGCASVEWLAVNIGIDNIAEETGLMIDMYSAALDGDNVHFAFIDDFNPMQMAEYFGDYISAVEERHIPKYIPVDKFNKGKELKLLSDGKILFPKNLKLVVSPTVGFSTAKLIKEAVYLDVSDIAECAPTVYNGQKEEYTVSRLAKAVERCRDVNYLSEDNWKKVDQLERYLDGLVGYSFTNRKFRIMERYSSAYLAAGGTEANAIDSMLVACVFSDLYSKRSKFKVEGEDAPDSFLERVFGAETVPAAIEMVRKFRHASPENENAEVAVKVEDGNVSSAANGNEVETEVTVTVIAEVTEGVESVEEVSAEATEEATEVNTEAETAEVETDESVEEVTAEATEEATEVSTEAETDAETEVEADGSEDSDEGRITGEDNN